MTILLLLLCILILFSTFQLSYLWNIGFLGYTKKRMKVLKSSYKKYQNLLTHDQMLHKFWVWDVEKLKRNK